MEDCSLRGDESDIPSMIYTSSGRLVYDPPFDRTTPRRWWAILLCDRELLRYYQHIYYTLYWKRLQTAVWNSHISIVRGETPKIKDAWKQYNGQTITFQYEYDGIFHSNSKHVWLPAYSDDLAIIRQSLGLLPNPYVPFHLSIGSL
jgi:hypothetical protein